MRVLIKMRLPATKGAEAVRSGAMRPLIQNFVEQT